MKLFILVIIPLYRYLTNCRQDRRDSALHYFHVEHTQDNEHIPACFLIFLLLNAGDVATEIMFAFRWTTFERWRWLETKSDAVRPDAICRYPLRRILSTDIQKRVFFGRLPTGYSHIPAHDQILTLQTLFTRLNENNMFIMFLTIEKIHSFSPYYFVIVTFIIFKDF